MKTYYFGGYKFTADPDYALSVEFENLSAQKLSNQRWVIRDGSDTLFLTPDGITYNPEEIIEVLYGQILLTQVPRYPTPTYKTMKPRRPNTMIYIAYGSNMSREQMAYRCPTAKLLGVGKMKGWDFEFFLHATLLPNREHPNATVPVAVWEISQFDRKRLDLYEGYPNYYKRYRTKVELEDGSEIEGMVYLMERYRVAPPTEEYYNGIEQAYHDLRLSKYIRTVLKPALQRSYHRH